MSKRTGLSKQRELKSEQLSRNNDVILTQQGYDNIPRLPMLIPCECRRVWNFDTEIDKVRYAHGL